ncbi:unnamed protein product [Durusdinium trenchii]|uniref:CHAD domain-containing protein n=1 Tax=Durusdinium trenchii TaxID=1381693 RepID=A0ABP0IL78_9DINO
MTDRADSAAPFRVLSRRQLSQAIGPRNPAKLFAGRTPRGRQTCNAEEERTEMKNWTRGGQLSDVAALRATCVRKLWLAGVRVDTCIKRITEARPALTAGEVNALQRGARELELHKARQLIPRTQNGLGGNTLRYRKAVERHVAKLCVSALLLFKHSLLRDAKLMAQRAWNEIKEADQSNDIVKKRRLQGAVRGLRATIACMEDPHKALKDKGLTHLEGALSVLEALELRLLRQDLQSRAHPEAAAANEATTTV